MKPHIIPKTRRSTLFGACVATSLGIALAQAGNPLLYTFEDLTVGVPLDGDPVANTGADALNTDGTIFIGAEGVIEVVEGGSAKFGNVRYDLGKSIRLDSVAGANGLNAAGVDATFLTSEVGLQGGAGTVAGPGDYTAMAWLNLTDVPTGDTNDNMIFGNAAGRRLHLGVRDTWYHSGHYADDLQTPNNTAQNGVWHHVAFVNDSATGTQTIYVDGVQLAQGAAGGNANSPEDGVLLIGSANGGGSFRGILDEVRVYDEILDLATIQLKAVEGLTPVVVPEISGGAFTDYTVAVITLEDYPGDGGDVDQTTVDMDVNGVPAEPENFVVTKVGGTTTITYTFPTQPAAASDVEFFILGSTLGGDDFDGTITLRATALPPEIRAGLGTPPTDTWDIIEILSGTPFSGVALTAWDEAVTLLGSGTITTQGPAPVINCNDPDNPGGGGLYKPDTPFLSDTAGDQNDLVIYGRMNLTIPAAGDYTFYVTGDDGYALRITGATFTGVSGAAQNYIDGVDPSVVCFPGFTGNSNGMSVCNFPSAGTYLVEFIGIEKGGGFYQELSWTPGAVTSIVQSGQWKLLGDHAAVEDTFVSPYTIPDGAMPELAEEGGWSTKIWYDATLYREATAEDLPPANITEALQFIGLVPDPEQIDALWSSVFVGALEVLNHSTTGANQGYINPTLPYPNGTEPPGSAPSASNIVMISRASLIIPADGLYTFQIRSDDGFLFRFLDPNDDFVSGSGAGQMTVAGPQARSELYFHGGTGNSDTRGVAQLTAGRHEIAFVWFDGGGGNHVEVSAAAGSFNAFSAADFWLVGQLDEPTVTGVGVTADGWAVKHIGPGLNPPIEDGNGGVGAGTFAYSVNARMASDGIPSSHDEIAFYDPSGTTPYNGPGLVAWPGNTPADDNNYAISGTATLKIETAGDYYLGWDADDGAYLQVTGQPFTEIAESLTAAGMLVESTPGSGIFDRLIAEVGAGNTRCIGLITLAAGEYPIEFGHYEAGGNSSVAIVGAPADGYVAGATLLPLGVSRGGQSYTPPNGALQLGGPTTPASGDLVITAINPQPNGDIALVFTSKVDETYQLSVSDDVLSFDPVGAEIPSAGGTTTSATITAAQLNGVLGAGPHPKVFVRVATVAGQ